MKPLKNTVLIAALCVGLSSVASAHLLDPTFFTTPSPIGDPSNEATYLENNFGTGPLTYLAKFDPSGSESGAVDISHFITVLGNGGNTATVTWNLTGTGFQLTDLLVKDGSTGGPNGQQIYAFYPVSADEGLIGSGSVQVNADASKAISHITFFGTT